MSSSTYIGNELELFSRARHWKSYYGKLLKPFIQGDVLEAGAGIGETTPYLLNRKVKTWTCLEPDQSLSGRITGKIKRGELPSSCRVLTGYTADIPVQPTFDTLLYIDVIEHIENDRAELQRAAGLLRTGGHLIILVPAHNFLRSPFDDAIGHYRRYNKNMLKSVVPEGFKIQKLSYLDSVGLFASLTNKFLLRNSMPTASQIAFWDQVIVPISTVADRLTFYQAGKTLIGVWKK